MKTPTGTIVLALALAATVPASAHAACRAGQVAVGGGPRHGVACLSRARLVSTATVPFTPVALERALEPGHVRGVRPAALRRSLRALRKVAATPALADALAPRTAARAVGRAAVPAEDPAIQAETIGELRPGEAGRGVHAYMDAGARRGFGMGESLYTTQCPDADGRVPVRGSHQVEMSMPMAADHHLTLVRWITGKAEATGTGHVGDDGRLIDFDLSVTINVRQTDTLYGPAGLVHGTPQATEFSMHVAVSHIALSGPIPLPDIDTPGTTLVTWIGNMNKADGVLRSYMLYPPIVERFREALAGAQSNFYDLAACMKAVYDPPSITLNPGEHRQIHATIASTVDGRPVPMNVTATAADGAVSTPASQHEDDGNVVYDYQAPGKPVTTATRLTGTSKRGRLGGAQVTVTVVKPDTFPYHYKVLAASFHTTSDARQSGSTATCNAHGFDIGGSNDFTGESGELAFDSSNQVSVSGGQVSGQVFAAVPAQDSQHLFGCKGNGDGTYSSCTADRQDTPSGGTWPIGFQVQAASPDAATAQLHWSLPDAVVGFTAGGDAACNVYELRQYVPYDATEQDVPMATLAGTQPFTLSFDGGPLHWDTTNINKPASIDYSWSLSLRLQRVDADGAPV